MATAAGFRIFITDDDSEDREFLISALKDTGQATDIKEFIDGSFLHHYLAEPSHELPHLIVLDLNMPLQDGFKTLNQLKSETRLQDIPVMVLTSSTNPEDERYCRQHGCVSYASKPMELATYNRIASEIVNLVHA